MHDLEHLLSELLENVVPLVTGVATSHLTISGLTLIVQRGVRHYHDMV